MYVNGLARRLAAAALAVIALSSFQATAKERVVVFAASSLKNALDSVNEVCGAEIGEPATISYAASSALARQIEAGAPADAFISADLDWMRYLSDRHLTLAASEISLLGNRIVLVAPADSDLNATIGPDFDLVGMLGGGRLAMANVTAVPAGKYGKAALESLGVWASVDDKIAQAENVRAALRLVATGEAPLGIVYQTDAAAEPGVRILGAFPDNSHPAIIYPAAQLASSKNVMTDAFLRCLRSEKARKLFEAQGFTMLAPSLTN